MTPEEIRKQIAGSASVQPSARAKITLVTENDEDGRQASPDLVSAWVCKDAPQGILKYIVLANDDYPGIMAQDDQYTEYMQAAAMPEGAVPPEGFDLQYREGKDSDRFAVARLVTRGELEQTLQKYIGGDKSFKADFEWYRVCESREQSTGPAGSKEYAEALYIAAQSAMEDQDENKRFQLCSKAAETGHAGAQGLLGVCHLLGFGTKVNQEAARACFEKSVSNAGRTKGEGAAKFFLAQMILYGDAPGYEIHDGVRLLGEATDSGIERVAVAEVFERLARNYAAESTSEKKFNFRRDLHQALDFARKASSYGSADAEQMVTEILSQIDT